MQDLYDEKIKILPTTVNKITVIFHIIIMIAVLIKQYLV